jgi:hypothetical protein
VHLSNLSRVITGSGSPTIVYPVNSVVPYIGATPSLPGWARWAGADTDFCLFGTATGTGTRTAATGTGIRHFSIPGSSGGGHTASIGASFPTNVSNLAGGSPMFSATTSYGSHSHVASSWSSYASTLRPRRAQFNFLLSTAEQTELPVNAMVFSQNTLSNLEEFTTTGDISTYISSGGSTITDGRINPGPTSELQVSLSGSAGGHTHWGGSGDSFAGGIGTTGRDIFTAGTHSHSGILTLFQSTFGNTVILRLFKALSALPPTRDIIIGYIGNSTNIPVPWFQCNGQNGTIDLRDRFVAINSTITAGTLLTGPTWEALNRKTGTVGDNISHSHGASTPRWFTGKTYGHLTGNWGHSHGTMTYNFDGTPITAPKVSIQFIQYKG